MVSFHIVLDLEVGLASWGSTRGRWTAVRGRPVVGLVSTCLFFLLKDAQKSLGVVWRTGLRRTGHPKWKFLADEWELISSRILLAFLLVGRVL